MKTSVLKMKNWLSTQVQPKPNFAHCFPLLSSILMTLSLLCLSGQTWAQGQYKTLILNNKQYFYSVEKSSAGYLVSLKDTLSHIHQFSLPRLNQNNFETLFFASLSQIKNLDSTETNTWDAIKIKEEITKIFFQTVVDQLVDQDEQGPLAGVLKTNKFVPVYIPITDIHIYKT